MNVWDILILLAVAAAAGLAFYHMRRKKSACGGGCSICEGCAAGTEKQRRNKP